MLDIGQSRYYCSVFFTWQSAHTCRYLDIFKESMRTFAPLGLDAVQSSIDNTSKLLIPPPVAYCIVVMSFKKTYQRSLFNDFIKIEKQEYLATSNERYNVRIDLKIVVCMSGDYLS